MKTKGQNIVAFVLAIVIIAFVVYVAAFGLGDFDGCFDEGGVTKGLDIAGGTSIIYSPSDNYDPTSDELNSAIARLRVRLDNLGYSEANVYSTSSSNIKNQIVVEIPGVSVEQDAIDQMGATAELTFEDYENNVMLTGSDIKKAEAAYGDPTNSGYDSWYVSLTLNSDSVNKFAEATEKISKYASGNNILAIKLDKTTVQSPSVSEKLTTENVVITGQFTKEDAEYYAGVINAGALPFGLNVESSSVIAATLGFDALEKCLWAGLIGILLVMLFMVILYRIPGLMAALALCAYMGLTGLAILVFHVNLSLAGIAGIVLAVGMAVDANVVIFERIKDEIRKGKTVAGAVKGGFHNALAAIIDSNVTTLIAAVVLYYYGTGSVKGFALTLLIGVILSFLTSVFVTKFFLERIVRMGANKPNMYGVKEGKAQ